MCGRFTAKLTWEQIHGLYRITSPDPRQAELDLKPRYNIAPTQMVPVVRLDANSNRELAMLRWGLIPSWAKDDKIAYSTINARAETVHEKPAFRAAFRKRRCLVPADGFYEWQATAGDKQPWLFTMKDGAPFAMAGLWERWEKGSEPIETFTIIVTQANAFVRQFHDRMPVILHPDTWDAWLVSPDTTLPMAMLEPFRGDKMTAYRVSKRVNSPKNDDANLIAPIGA
jgi:putative SOS response-associated peptidase YedK